MYQKLSAFYFLKVMVSFQFVCRKKESIHPTMHTYMNTYPRTIWKNRTFWALEETACNVLQNRQFLKFNLIIDWFRLLGSIVITLGSFKAALGSKPITILYSSFAMNKVKNYSEHRISKFRMVATFQLFNPLYLINC